MATYIQIALRIKLLITNGAGMPFIYADAMRFQVSFQMSILSKTLLALLAFILPFVGMNGLVNVKCVVLSEIVEFSIYLISAHSMRTHLDDKVLPKRCGANITFEILLIGVNEQVGAQCHR